MVIAFTSVGFDGAVAVPGSLSAMCMVASPESPKIVGHGLSWEHGAGEMTFVITSEISVLAGVPAVAAPRTPRRESTTRYEGARPLRTTSPHDVAVAPRATNARNRFRFRMEVMAASAPDDSRRDEDEQLRTGVVHGVAPEQPSEQRNPADARRPIGLVLLVGHVDAAYHRRRAIAHQHAGVGALRVDRR